MKDPNVAAQKMAYDLCKMDRVVLKKLPKLQADPTMEAISVYFTWLPRRTGNRKGCQRLLRVKSLYIRVSIRPCYFCSLFFKAVQENRRTLVSTHGKLYGKWNKFEGCIENKSNQVWAKTTEEDVVTSENCLSESGSRPEEDDYDKMRRIDESIFFLYPGLADSSYSLIPNKKFISFTC
jgi:hypothetical protein